MNVIHHRRQPIRDPREHFILTLIDLRSMHFIRRLTCIQDRIFIGEQLERTIRE